MQEFFTIGGLKICLEYGSGNYKGFLDKALDTFSSNPFESPDIRFHVDATSPFPSLDSYKKIFTSNPAGLWTILEDAEKSHYIISLQGVERDREPYKMVRADREFSRFVIYARPTRENLLFPLEYPLADLAISAHLNINRIGIILHSACISLGGKGYLFSGVSGSGKSTISQIWQKDGDAEVLTDERVIIREFQGDLWAFGTPWHGTAGIHKSMGVLIKKIFFIKHGAVNKARQITKTDAANGLIVRCFPTFWNTEGMQFALDFCTRIAQGKAYYELEFIPDSSIRKYIRNLEF